jgi:hypothetical protein
LDSSNRRFVHLIILRNNEAMEVDSKPSISLKVKAGRRIQAQEYIELSIEYDAPTPILSLSGDFESTSTQLHVKPILGPRAVGCQGGCPNVA